MFSVGVTLKVQPLQLQWRDVPLLCYRYATETKNTFVTYIRYCLLTLIT